MYVSSKWFMNRLAYIGAHFVPMATPKICKCSLSQIKLLKVSMSHRNTVITCVNLLLFLWRTSDVDAFFVGDGGAERLDV